MMNTLLSFEKKEHWLRLIELVSKYSCKILSLYHPYAWIVPDDDTRKNLKILYKINALVDKLKSGEA